jgi:hypothetical protein
MRCFLALLTMAAAPAFGSHILPPIRGTCGFYGSPQPTEEEIENCVKVFAVRFVEAINGRPR